MDAKTKITANGTYVLDPEDVEQLDELSLTSVMKEAVDAIPQVESSPKTSDTAASTGDGDTTINAILRGMPSAEDQPSSALPQAPAPSESTGDLLAPELIFPDLTPPRR